MLSCLKVSPLHCLCWSYLCLAYAGLIYAGCLIVQTDAKSEAGNSCHKTHYYNPGFATPNLRIIHLSASFTCDPDMVMIYGWWRCHDYNPIAGSSHRHPRELLCYVIRGEFRIGVPNRRHQQSLTTSQSSASMLQSWTILRRKFIWNLSWRLVKLKNGVQYTKSITSGPGTSVCLHMQHCKVNASTMHTI